MFRSARWAYDVTGGSPKDPSLTKLKDKHVVIVGTGATAVQILPQLAKWCRHLYVVQRTPASVDVRDQRETDGNYRFNLDEYAKHISHILVEAKRRANVAPFVVAPSAEAAEDWGHADYDTFCPNGGCDWMHSGIL